MCKRLSIYSVEDRLEFKRSKSLNKPAEITSCAEQEEANGVIKEELLPGGEGRGAGQVMPTQGRDAGQVMLTQGRR